MKLNQKGAFDLTLVAALVIVVAVGAFVLTRISEDRDEVSSTETSDLVAPEDKQDSREAKTSEEKENAAVLPDGFTEYVSKEFGITFAHPELWSVEVKTDFREQEYISVTSQDYTEKTEAIGSTTTATGAIVDITVTSTELNNVSEIEFVDLQKQLFDSEGVAELLVDGVDAIAYEWNYEGDAALVYRVISNGFDTTISFNGAEAADEILASEYADFTALLGSLKLN